MQLQRRLVTSIVNAHHKVRSRLLFLFFRISLSIAFSSSLSCLYHELRTSATLQDGTDSATLQPYSGNSLHLSPTTRTVHSPQPLDILDGCPNCNLLNLSNLTDDLEVRAVHGREIAPPGSAEAQYPDGSNRAALLLSACLMKGFSRPPDFSLCLRVLGLNQN